MAIYFRDTSALVKRYIQETGTAWIQNLCIPTVAHSLFIARITLPETISAVTRRERSGGLLPADAITALTDFQQDFDRQFLIVEISSRLLNRAAALTRKYGLRAYDGVQLAAALEVRAQDTSTTLVSADTDLNAAASAESLTLEDPNAHP
ncbi:MAG: type II toxin-antitoxin system VapC family toxin [Isosphaeraceae bacterium]